MSLKPRINPADEPAIRKAFQAAVNMSPTEIGLWLETAESRSVGTTRRGETESVGRQSARRIIALLGTPADELTESDFVHMKKVTGYVKRHRAQHPRGDISRSRWRYSLMNWGNDPLNDPQDHLR